MWTAVDSLGNVIYQSDKILGVEKNAEGLLGGYIYNEKGKAICVYFDEDGNIALKSPTLKPFEFTNGRAIAIQFKDTSKKEALFGFIDRKGKVIVPIKYLDIMPFSENLSYIMNQEERGIIDTNGNFTVKKSKGFSAYYGFTDGLITVSTAEESRMGMKGVMDSTGNMVIDYIYTDLGRFSEGLCKAYSSGTWGYAWGYINRHGDLLIDYRFDEAMEFKEGRAFVGRYSKSKGKYEWAVIDTDGTLISGYIFEGLPKYFSEGLAAVQFIEDGDNWKYVNKSGKVVIDNNFVFAGSFKDGIALVVDSKAKKYFINNKGNKVFELPENANVILDCRTNERYESGPAQSITE